MIGCGSVVSAFILTTFILSSTRFMISYIPRALIWPSSPVVVLFNRSFDWQLRFAIWRAGRTSTFVTFTGLPIHPFTMLCGNAWKPSMNASTTSCFHLMVLSFSFFILMSAEEGSLRAIEATFLKLCGGRLPGTVSAGDGIGSFIVHCFGIFLCYHYHF